MRIFLSELNVLECATSLPERPAGAGRKGGLTCTRECRASADLGALTSSRHRRRAAKDGIRMARPSGPPVIRCFLGRQDDRGTRRHRDAHQEHGRGLQSRARRRAADGARSPSRRCRDMQAGAGRARRGGGPDYVGVNIDPATRPGRWRSRRQPQDLAPYVAARASATRRSCRRRPAWSSSRSRSATATSTQAMGGLFAEKVGNVRCSSRPSPACAGRSTTCPIRA